MKIVERIGNLLHRISWMSRLTGSKWSALLFWLSASRNIGHIGQGGYRGADIVFRGLDTMALKEVLVDEEYAKVIERIATYSSPVVLDVGAHIGLFSLSVLKAVPTARVLSVEADSLTYEILSCNVASLCAHGAAWEAINAAGWDEDGKQLCFDGGGPSMSHRVSSSGKSVVTSITLKTLINQMFEKYSIIDLLKVDIEGSEEAFLCAAPDMLRHVRVVVVELHPLLCNVDRVRAVLSQVYRTVEEIQDRVSAKPLLMCY